MRDRLITGLQETLPQPAKQVVLKEGFLHDDLRIPPKSSPQPSIQLAMGAVEFNIRSQERGFVETAMTPITVMREFRQQWGLEIWGQTTAQVESLGSLAIAILLTNHDALLETYNTGQPPGSSKTEYRAGSFASLHHLSQFRLVAGVPFATETGTGLLLKFEALGQLTLTQTVPEGQSLIQTIPLTVTLASDGDERIV